jgi:hypothetical protein
LVAIAGAVEGIEHGFRTVRRKLEDHTTTDGAAAFAALRCGAVQIACVVPDQSGDGGATVGPALKCVEHVKFGLCSAGTGKQRETPNHQQRNGG